MDIKTQITTDELGQTVIHLSKEDWEAYGKQAGYFPEVVKEASAEAEIAEKVKEEVTIASLQAEIKEMKDKMASLESTEATKESATDPHGGIGSNSVIIREDNGFTEENYPNLVAEQQQDGLIGPFAPRH
jgi:FtsZ-binding cell division protein ZapB